MPTENAAPRFSVIVPTYHRNDLLRICLNALAPSVQTVEANEYEVIVTDDGKISTSEAMLRDEFPWARWVAGPKKGPAANRNSAARHANGDWLIFTDDDCVPAPGFIAGYKDAAMVSSAQSFEGKTTCEEGIDSPLYTSPTNLNGGCSWSCNIMVRRDLFGEMNGFDESFAFSNEDTDLRERTRQRGQAIVFVPEAKINHPPRLRKLGAKVAVERESFVQMWYMAGNHSALKISYKLIALVVRVNIEYVRSCRFSKDTLLSIAYGIAETFTVAAYLPRWINKYKNQFDGYVPRYNYPY